MQIQQKVSDGSFAKPPAKEKKSKLPVDYESNQLIEEKEPEERIEDSALSLLSSEDRYHKMIEEVRDYAIILLDKQGNILNWNKGAEKIKGYTEKEIVGKNFRTFYLEEDRKKKLPERLINEAREHGKATHEGWRLRKDGSRFWGSIVITAVHDEQNNVIGFSKVTRDLTDKKIAEDRLYQYAKDLESQNKALEEYAFIASHDLQEPLRSIQVYAELLKRNLDDKEEIKKYLDKITASSRRMSTLIKDILSYTKLSKTDQQFAPTDLNEVLKNVVNDFDLLIGQKNVVINSDKLPVVNGIYLQLQQLFSNLVSNSIKFSEKNPVIKITSKTISAVEKNKYAGLDSNSNYIEILYKDNGIGFEQKYADQIFKLFRRLHHNEHTTGTGIGLALCRKIVENHKGYIEASSKPNKGTTFRILLPAL